MKRSSFLKYTFLHFISPCHTNQLTILYKTTPKSFPVYSAAVLVKTNTMFSQFELQLWRNSHVFFLSPFITQTSSLYEKTSPFLKYANNSSDDAINLTEYEKLDFLQKDSTTCTPQYDYTSFVTMATFIYLIVFKSLF